MAERQQSAYEWLAPQENRAIYCGCTVINEQNAMSGHCGDDYIKFCPRHSEAHVKELEVLIANACVCANVYRDHPTPEYSRSLCPIHQDRTGATSLDEPQR